MKKLSFRLAAIVAVTSIFFAAESNAAWIKLSKHDGIAQAAKQLLGQGPILVPFAGIVDGFRLA